jgi:hypothetical protein
MNQLLKAQLKVCDRQGVSPDPPAPNLKLGISKNFSLEDFPINGLRHPADESTCGWFIWSGEEPSSAPDYFDPMHVKHVEDRYPEVAKYLALPAGWRFLFAPDYEDIWFDDSLFDI